MSKTIQVLGQFWHKNVADNFEDLKRGCRQFSGFKDRGLGFDEYKSPGGGYLENVFPVPDGVEEVEGLCRVPQGQHAVQGGALHVGLGQGGQAGGNLGGGAGGLLLD